MKTKVSVSIPRDLLAEIDSDAAQPSRSRGQIVPGAAAPADVGSGR